MVRRVINSIRNLAKSVGDFVMHVLHAPKGESTPDPNKAAAKRVREAMHARSAGPGGGMHGFGNSRAGRTMDKLIGKELAEGHKEARKAKGR